MAEHSPTPWRVAGAVNGGDGYYIEHAGGYYVADVFRKDDAALIVEAVNERDRLRDIVRRLADTLQSIIDAAEGRGVGRLDEGLVREAREALGEDNQ